MAHTANNGSMILDTERALTEAHAMGLEWVGVANLGRSDHIARFRRWIAASLHGEMAYLARPDAVRRRADLDRALSGFRSALVVAQSYANDEPATSPGDPSRAIVARYARGRDYHRVLHERLEDLARRLEDLAGRPFRRRAYVDTGPLLEREVAMRAGLGWFGKNTMLIHPRRGSYFFLGVLLTDLPLTPSDPFDEDHCGTCRRCLDACPTGALLGRDDNGAPVMDATRCISYLTIELKGPIPHELRSAIGNRVFGCDICQEVCPWNERFSKPTAEPDYSPRSDLDGVSLIDLATRLLEMSGKGFLREFRDSPVARARRNGLLRNVCVALGNWGSQEAIPVLERAAHDRSELVREHAAWALERLG
ncbi:MAG: tRNA epoxyqueuosine(34) reductase QueG [Gemmatimonadetes bacterium]|nr:tRNA epoxyqueuosine(34) reductase QueG [Gemmatimonadota bacterium]MXX70382.1 tRNA epoxyqueuosine(34) reductase QueG [Gemmatimonadota bacterium]MYC90751.1 tRNA epoxyqueuosine(34) reductase QueG [Gemmatimonadota bacterium]MYG36448.1 tRNA epoxyqueuosine(34) reductase QueG [Gemmatimonadota bacterium]MYJ19037.1 tRNA epoxyqueuosine(34) reductase QueG [Gemmatimonadota bacterium]